ncbi:MAG: NAD(P)/FAD-dependent oxidoreductase [Gemmataceae bacterium]
MDEAVWEVIVAGAGAAGLMAGLRAAERGERVLVVEKNKRPGVKILMSGGTRCNITQATDNRGVVEAYGPPGRFLHSALAAFGVKEAIDLFEAEGVATKVEETGKVFPVSDKAADVLAALVNRLNRSGAALALAEPVQQVERSGEGFRVLTSRRSLSCQKFILTVGGMSYPGSGTTGDGYAIAQAFGHTIVPPYPALVPLTTAEAWIASLRGVTLPDARLAILEGDKALAQRRGSLLFAHFGLTGPVALDVSRVVSRHPRPGSLRVRFDFLPDVREEELAEKLREQASAAGKKQLAGVLASFVPKRLAEELLRLSGMDVERKAAGLTREERGRLVAACKRLDVPLTGTLGFKKAEVTTGGVDLREVDSRTMQSKLVPGLYFAGEVLDLDGPIGGYNFQAAWSTGWLAGSSV